MHRLEETLTDSMVWNFVLLNSGHPITPLEGRVSKSLRAADNHLVVYCADSKAENLKELRKVITAHAGKCVVATWAPERVSAAIGDWSERVSVLSVPDDVTRAFRRWRQPSSVKGE
jgi:adenine-specific DNA-methyltransferase